ncbi:unnamed protein product [Trichobilharzia szidati]|nr:unnamed protein product [Trichobilharzia szidati]
MKWQSNLYINLIDFEKAFDRVDREVIWKLLEYYGLLQIFINLIQQLYDNGTCQVIHNRKLSEAFGVNTGVRQGCLLSPTIFLIVVDWIMRQTVGNEKTGIPWTDMKNQEDLDFADDLCLMTHKTEDLQAKTDKLVEEAGSEDRTPGEHRQDGGYENNQPTTTTAAATYSANHHQREGFERGYFFHLSREHCLNYRRNGRGCQIENREGEKHIHQPGTNLEIFVTQHQQQNSDFQYKRQVSSSIRVRKNIFNRL